MEEAYLAASAVTERPNKTSQAVRSRINRKLIESMPNISPFIDLPCYKLNKTFYLTRLHNRSREVVTQVIDS